MKKDDFLVSRRYAGGPFDLVRAKRNALQMSMEWNNRLTTFDRDIGFGLFNHTSPKDAHEWQEVTARELVDIVNVAAYVDADNAATESPHGVYYQKAFRALERLYSVSIPFRRTDIVKGKKRRQFGMIRFLQGFALVYYDTQGREVDLDDPGNGQQVVDIQRRYEGDQTKQDRQRASGSWGAVQAIAETDPDGNIVELTDGRPKIRPPDAYRFLWASDIADDLADSRKGGKGSGWIKCSVDIFRVKKALRDKKQRTAAALFNLLISDLWAADPPECVTTEKKAKDLFVMLGFANPGKPGIANHHKQDGRWTENIASVQGAVQALKAEGVLLPESDELPRIDANPDRRKAPYYRWKRPKEWVMTGTPEIVKRVAAMREQARIDPPPTTQGHPTGQEIRAAREAAGLTVRQFAAKFGKSIGTWSKYESGKTIPFPRGVDRKVVDAFVRDHVPGYRGESIQDGQTDLFQGGMTE